MKIYKIKYNDRVQDSMRYGEKIGDSHIYDHATIGEYHPTYGKRVKEIREVGMYFPMFDIDFENGDSLRIFNPIEVLFKKV